MRKLRVLRSYPLAALIQDDQKNPREFRRERIGHMAAPSISVQLWTKLPAADDQNTFVAQERELFGLP